MNERIKLDLIEAMKSKEELRLSTIRLLKGAIEIEEKKIKKSLEDSEILDIISKQVKLRKESIIEFEKANRLDAVDKLNKELDILYDYLPEQLSTNELLILIDEAIKEINATSSKDFGNVMKIVVPKIKGKADSKEVSEIIKNKLQ